MIDSRFYSGYYVMHAMMFALFLAFRQRIPPKQLQILDPLGFTREGTVWLSLAMVIGIRVVSVPTIDAFMAHAFKFTKIAMLVVLYYMQRSLAVVFGVLFVVIYVLFPQPRAKDPKCVQVLNRGNFDSRITNNKALTIWVVQFYATWSPLCTQVAPIFATLATQHNHVRLRFGKVDVSMWPDLAERMNIDVGGASRQIPTYIAYKQGQEVARLPRLSADGSTVIDDLSNRMNLNGLESSLSIKELYKQAVDWEEDAKRRYAKDRAKARAKSS